MTERRAPGPSIMAISVSTTCRLCLSLLLLTMTVWTTQACFIRNCPKGGKRSVGSLEAIRQCMACGPANMGQCVGPSICCGIGFGCLMGTVEAEVCRKENESSIPCSVTGRICGIDDMGRCVADGICCVNDACSYNSLCKVTEEESESTQVELLALIRRLLDVRQYD